jgi:aspartate/glutamate racemase
MPTTQQALSVIPDIELLSILDDALLRTVIEHGVVTPAARARMATHLRLAAEADSDAVLVTCNIYSLAVRDLRADFGSLPILAVDEPMAEQAVMGFSRIGVLGTGRSGLDAQVALLEDTAARAGRRVDIVSVLCAEAFHALTAGDGRRHDELLVEAMTAFDAADVEVVVLAQASMARVVDALPEGGPPVLSSPGLAAAELSRILQQQ